MNETPKPQKARPSGDAVFREFQSMLERIHKDRAPRNRPKKSDAATVTDPVRGAKP